MSEDTNFQRRATREGQDAKRIAITTLEHSGFSISEVEKKFPDLGPQINIIADDTKGDKWYFDVSGSHQTGRPGLQRTDTAYKTLARSCVFAKNGYRPYILLTTHAPKPGLTSDKTIRSIGFDVVYDVIEMVSTEGRQKLENYAKRGINNFPLPGYWSFRDIYGSDLVEIPNLRNASSLPIGVVEDPLEDKLSPGKLNELPHRCKFMIPSITREGHDILDEKRNLVINQINDFCIDFGGGCSTIEAEGSWAAPVGEISSENIKVIEVYSRQKIDDEKILEFADLINSELDQAVASIVVDDKMILINR